MSSNPETIMTTDAVREALAEALEFVEGQEDVVDGPDGEQCPNRAMQVAQALRAALEECRSSVKFDRDRYSALVLRAPTHSIRVSAEQECGRLGLLLDRIDVLTSTPPEREAPAASEDAIRYSRDAEYEEASEPVLLQDEAGREAKRARRALYHQNQ